MNAFITFTILSILYFCNIKTLQASELVESNTQNDNPKGNHGKILETFPLSDEYEKIMNDLNLLSPPPKDISTLNSSDKCENIIKQELESRYFSRTIFKQNCEKYNPLIFSKILNSLKFNLEHPLDEYASLVCLDRVTEMYHFSNSAIDHLSLEYFNFLIKKENFLKLIMQKFEKNELPNKFMTKEICNSIFDKNSIPYSKKIGQIVNCFQNLFTDSEFMDNFIEIIKDFVFFSGIISVIQQVFLNESLSSIRNNDYIKLMKILASWKKIIKFILDHKWNENVVTDELFYALNPAFSLKSTIFHEESKYKDFELVEAFKILNDEQKETIQKKLNEIISLLESHGKMNHHDKVENDDIVIFMNPNLSIESIKDFLLRDSYDSNDSDNCEFLGKLLISIAKFNPENFNESFQIVSLTKNCQLTLDRLSENIPNFLDYPIENNILLYHISLSNMEKHFSINDNSNEINKQRSMEKILKFINNLDSMPYPEANTLVTLNLLLATRPTLNENVKKRINFLFAEWKRKSQLKSHIKTNQELLELLKKDSKFDWIRPLSSEILSFDLNRWFIKKSRQLETLLSPHNNLSNLNDPQKGKIVSRNSDDFNAIYLLSPQRLSSKFHLGKKELEQLKKNISTMSPVPILSNHLFKSIFPRKTDYSATSYYEDDYSASYMLASGITKEKNLDLINQTDIITFINKFDTLFDSGQYSHMQFTFQSKEIGDGPSGEYLHAILKSIFIHTDTFGIVNNDNGIRLPAPMIHPRIIKVLGIMTGQLLACFNIIPDVSFDDSILKYIHNLSNENLEIIWREYSVKNDYIRGLVNMLNGKNDIKDAIFNIPQSKLTLTNLKFDESINTLRLDQSNWKEMMDGGDSFPSFYNDLEARKFLEERIELIKSNFFDGLRAFKKGLDLYFHMDMIENQGRSFTSLFPSKIISKKDFIQRLTFHKNLNMITITSSKIDGNGKRIPNQISINQGLIDFLRELKDDDYKKLLSKWIISPYIANLNNLKPNVDLAHGDSNQPLPCISRDSMKILETFGYPLMNPPLSLNISCNRDMNLITHTCFSQLSLYRYETIDELRTALLILAHSDDAHRARD